MSVYDERDPETGMTEREAGDAVFDELMMGAAKAARNSSSDVESGLLLALVGIANRLDKQCDLVEQSIALMREATDIQREALGRVSDDGK
jgi:hypothetical protein